MLTETELAALVPLALTGVDIPQLGPKTQGKVRDIYRRGSQLILITTDRLSAFDRVLGAIPYKGQVLNQLSQFWFEQVSDVTGSALIDVPDPNVTVAHACQPLPVEVIVRGYITGVTKTALWYRYNLGEREIYGHHFPDGLTKNQPLPQAIITPTTKGGPTGHDERLTCDEVVEKGLLDRATWDTVQVAALEIFRRGQEITARAGLILVDTKYEFGRLPNGQVVLIDEVHTPDSSRFWKANSYESRLAAGEEPENFDKEFIRLWYAARGYRGDGEPPAWNTDLAVQASRRYQQVFEMLTGREFEPDTYPAAERIKSRLANEFGE
ncbi:MAG: phosphoribosylaminoimidazolesuccinocarboxamide synthase [Chloroflexi bacterium]|nr:MAG: phosphoribosylaminoimidazolesuccinocarboxamide synthase [Chloroflexota bacterium]